MSWRRLTARPVSRCAPTIDLYQGKAADGSWAKGFPASLHVDMKFLERGRDRFTLYCAPCHGAVGDGNGVTKRYGMGATATYQDDRLRKMTEGEIFNTDHQRQGEHEPLRRQAGARRPLGRHRLRARAAARPERAVWRTFRKRINRSSASNERSCRTHFRRIEGPRHRPRGPFAVTVIPVSSCRGFISPPWPPLVGIAFLDRDGPGGALLMVMIHHVVDAGVVGLSCAGNTSTVLAAFKWLGLLFLPLVLLFLVRAERRDLAVDESLPRGPRRALRSRRMSFTSRSPASWANMRLFTIMAAVFFWAVESFISSKLRKASFTQDSDGDPKWTTKDAVHLRVWNSGGGGHPHGGRDLLAEEPRIPLVFDHVRRLVFRELHARGAERFSAS